MKARHAEQIRRGIVFARNFCWFTEPSHRRVIYASFMKTATYLEYKAFERTRLRQFSE